MRYQIRKKYVLKISCVKDQLHESAFQPIPNSPDQKFLLNYLRKNKDITLFDNFAKEIYESQYWEFRCRIIKENNELQVSENENEEYFCKNIGC